MYTQDRIEEACEVISDSNVDEITVDEYRVYLHRYSDCYCIDDTELDITVVKNKPLEEVVEEFEMYTEYKEKAERFLEGCDIDDFYGWSEVDGDSGQLYTFEDLFGNATISLEIDTNIHNKRWFIMYKDVNGKIINKQPVDDETQGVYRLIRILDNTDEKQSIYHNTIEDVLTEELVEEISRLDEDQAEKIAKENRRKEQNNDIYVNEDKYRGIGEETVNKIYKHTKEKNLIENARKKAKKELITEHDKTELLAKEM
jgi:hypothetical protein